MVNKNIRPDLSRVNIGVDIGADIFIGLYPEILSWRDPTRFAKARAKRAVILLLELEITGLPRSATAAAERGNDICFLYPRPQPLRPISA